MDNNSRTLYGYHGTTKEAAKDIIKTKSYRMSCGEEEWLGVGVYFFENDRQQAIDFCVKARKYKEWSVLYNTINSEKLLDLVDTQTYNEFKKFANKLKNRYKKLSDGRARELMNSVILNTIYNLQPYDVVRAVFPVPSTENAPRTNIGPVQIQISVRSRECIMKDCIKEVCFSEC